MCKPPDYRAIAMLDRSLQTTHQIHAITQRQQELAARVARLAPVDGTHPSALIPTLALTRGSVPTVCVPTVYQPSLGIVVQGRKRAVLNGEVFHYDALNYLVVSVTLPAMGQVLEASAERPYLSLRLHLDLDEIARLLLQLGDRGPPPADSNRGLFVARMDEALLDAVLRLVKLLDAPDDVSVLAPVVQREIYYRMLRGELGHRLIDLAQGDAANHRIVRVIEWLKQRYAAPLRIEELAEAGAHEPLGASSPLQGGHRDVAAAVPEAFAAARGAAADVRRWGGVCHGRASRRL